MRIKEIGARFGYEDLYYFSRIFIKHVGHSPTKFRKEER
jgi:YesN/AraC family two-component response regulator